jgi:diketogulonate reductase-like aldo/keto reductase
MPPARTPALKLNNDATMPALGLGVFQSPPEETLTAVETALRVGYRLIDTAAAYGNERETGEAIRRSGVPRDEIFVTTKLWISDYGYDAAQVHRHLQGVRQDPGAGRPALAPRARVLRDP